MLIRKYFTFIRGLSVLIFLKIRILSLLAGWIESFVCGIYTFRSKLTLLRVIVYNVIDFDFCRISIVKRFS